MRNSGSAHRVTGATTSPAAVAGALAIAMTAVLLGCSGNSSDPLDQGSLADQLEVEAGLTAPQAKCASDALADANLTADDVTKLNEGTAGVTDTKVKAYVDAMVVCVNVEPPG